MTKFRVWDNDDKRMYAVVDMEWGASGELELACYYDDSGNFVEREADYHKYQQEAK